MTQIETEKIVGAIEAIAPHVPFSLAKNDVVSNRRGSVTIRVNDGEVYALKIGFDLPAEVGRGENPRFLVMREGEVVSTVPMLRERHVAHGDLGQFSFAAMKWVDGVSLPLFLRQQRDTGSDAKIALRRTANSLFRYLATLHSEGWLHGDLQGEHMLVAREAEVALIDFALAQGNRPLTPISYRGGLVHFNAPEICAQVRAAGVAAPTIQSELFSAASVLFWIATGKVYPRYSGDPRTLDWIQLISEIADARFHPIDDLHPFVDDQLFQALSACLQADPTARPRSAADVANMIA